MNLRSKHQKELNNKTPGWFKDFYYEFFKPVEQRSSRNERLLYLILTAVLALNTVGNYFHEDIFNFLVELFGGG